MALKTYADWEDAVRVARVVYDHSLARMVTRAKTVKKSKKMAFLSVLPTKSRTDNKSGGDSSDTNKSSSAHVKKSETAPADSKQSSKKNSVKGKVQIFVATPCTSTICLQLHPSTSISAIKGLLQDQLGTNPKNQHLFTRQGLELCDVLSLADHGIGQDANIELRLAPGLMGGRKKRKPGKKEAPKAHKNFETHDAQANENSPEPQTVPATGAAASFTTQSGVSAQHIQLRNVRDSVVIIGSADGCHFHKCAKVLVKIDVTKGAVVDDGSSENLFHMLKRMVEKIGKTETLALLTDVFKAYDTEHAKAEIGSVTFILHIKSREGLNKLWNMFTSGELAKQLTEILITDELTTEDKSGLAIQVTILENDYKQACRFFEHLEKEAVQEDLPPRMSDWTKKHVKSWLLSIDVPDIVADQFYEEEVDGLVLKDYTEEDLVKDYTMKKGHLRRILYQKKDWLHSEEQQSGSVWEAKAAVRSSASDEVEVTADPSVRFGDTLDVLTTSNGDEVHQPAVRPKIRKPYDKSSTKKGTKEGALKPIEVKKDAGPMKAGNETLTMSSENVSSQDFCELEHFPPSTDVSNSQGSAFKHVAAVKRAAIPSSKVTPFQGSDPVPSGSETTKDKVTPSDPDFLPNSGKQRIQTSWWDVDEEQPNQAKPSAPSTASTDTHVKEAPTRGPETITNKLSQEAPANHEARLRMLLTGDENGELDQSYFPVLVANKPELPAHREQFGFVKKIKWTTVLDLNSKSKLDGLCKLYHDDRMVTLQQPDFFKRIDSVEDFRTTIDFPEKTVWVFANGREDEQNLQAPKMTLREWHTNRSKDVESSVSFFSNPLVIPETREVIMFLLLSDDDMDILCETFGKLSSSFPCLQSFCFIAEDPEVYSKFVEYVDRWFPKDEIDKRSFVGHTWQEINFIMMRMTGLNKTKRNELPSSFPGNCFLSEKQKDEWDTLTILCKNECENTDMDETSPSYERFVQKKELDFYRGGKVDWWNFAIGEKDVQLHGGCGHVLKRQRFEEILEKVENPLKSSKIGDSLIVTVSLLHQPGAGGSTLARHVLWKLHKKYRCIVVDRVTSDTVRQIMAVREYGYDTNNVKIPPVCVLVDNRDDLEVLDLLEELEIVTKDIRVNGGTACVLLHCKRNADPEETIKTNRSKKTELYIPLTQKLDSSEKKLFQQKYCELEHKEIVHQTGDYSPDNLLAFMVMKEEFSKEYIRNVVSKILRDITGKELKLIKLCAFLNSYMHETDIPISCCDSFMTGTSTVGMSTSVHRKKSTNWEKQVSASFKMMVVMKENRSFKILHKSIAEEAFRQITDSGNQSLVDVTLEFLRSELLGSSAYSRKNLARTTHDLLIRRERLGHGEDTKAVFSVLIEDVCKYHGSAEAIEILQTGIEKLEDAFVAQQLARFYLIKERDFESALTFAEVALEINPQNSFFWDTKGRVYKAHFDTLTEPYVIDQQALGGDDFKQAISLALNAIDTFRKSYNVSKEAAQTQTEYTGLYAELCMIFRLLHVIHLCVEPFRTHRDSLKKYLLFLEMPQDVNYPTWNNEIHRQIRELKDKADDVLAIMDGKTTYYKDGSAANIVGKKLDDMIENIKKYSSIYEIYYGEPQAMQSGTYINQDPTSLAEYRRRCVKQLHCGSFREIFDLAKAKNVRKLEESRRLLMDNSSNYNSFDLRILVCIHLALSSIGEQSEKADDVYKQFVRPFVAMDRGESCWAPFLMMMFLWPIEGVVSERRDKYDLITHTKELKKRWNAYQILKEKSLPQTQEKVRRLVGSRMRPRTHFFLGRGKDLRVFAHINELHTTEGRLDRRDTSGDKFWQSDFVKSRLARLEGTLLNSTTLLHRLHKDKDPIEIKLAVPYPEEGSSQESVIFFLGFSWNGPVACGVTIKGTESRDNAVQHSFSQAYPEDILPSGRSKVLLSANPSNINRILEESQKLSRKVQELGDASFQVGRTKHKKDEENFLKAKKELQRQKEKFRRAWHQDEN